MFDVHCHIDFEDFDNDRNKVIERAFNENVKIITCAFGVESIEKTKKILNINEFNKKIFVSYGISPLEYDNEKIKKFIEILMKDNEIIGVGEVGLDYYWEKDVEKRKIQIENFKNFIEISEKIRKPLIIHSRNAEKDVIEILKSYNVKALLHCFSGSLSLAREAIDFGCLISIPTSVYYSKSKMKLVENLEIENLVTETDAPFLSPFPKENKRNEPLNVKFSIKKISELKNLDYDYVDEIIEKNVKKFFGIK
ncbi:MAG: TatD family hydrolase [Candidatus Altarchaeaceae archaeon]